MKNIFLSLLAIALVIAVGGAGKPYWDRYWIEKELEAAAVYGTKNSVHETKESLFKKLQEKAYPIGEEELYIEKDSRNHVTVTARYSDEISIFGKELKKLRFTVTATAREVKEYF